MGCEAVSIVWNKPGMLISLDLPLPPSKNRLHDNAVRWTKATPDKPAKRYMARKLSDDYEAYRTEVWAEVMRQTTPEQRDALQGKHLAIYIMVRYPDATRRRDPANVVDGLLDALQAPLGVDDSVFKIGGWKEHELVDLPECSVLIGEADGG